MAANRPENKEEGEENTQNQILSLILSYQTSAQQKKELVAAPFSLFYDIIGESIQKGIIE